MEHIRHTTAQTSLGELTLAATGDALTGLYFPHHRPKPSPAALGVSVDLASDPLLVRAARELDEYLDGRRTSFDVAYRHDGDAFQELVWGMLDQIPFGETVTYGDLARRLGDVALSYRVGQAVASNPLSIVVPCHRVVGKDGKLTGYAGGLRRKRELLDLEEPERVTASRLF